MIINITKKCHEECPHCMNDAKPDGDSMERGTFISAIRFGVYGACPVYLIGGGEPTEHPEFYDFMFVLNELLEEERKENPIWSEFNNDPEKKAPYFTVLSNGTWITDKEKTEQVKKVLAMKHCMKMQVTSVPLYYKSYPIINEHRKEIEDIIGLPICVQIEQMQDLGRASGMKYMRLVEKAKSPSCANPCLFTRQSNNLVHMFLQSMMYGKLCFPVIDIRGNVHMSESVCCPDIGCNINDTHPDDIFKAMKEFKPCGRCFAYKKLFMKGNEKYKELLGL